jgi:hypothetical protein
LISEWNCSCIPWYLYSSMTSSGATSRPVTSPAIPCPAPTDADLYGFEVTLAKTKQPYHGLHDLRGAHALQDGQPRINHLFHLGCLATLTDQGQTEKYEVRFSFADCLTPNCAMVVWVRPKLALLSH